MRRGAVARLGAERVVHGDAGPGCASFGKGPSDFEVKCGQGRCRDGGFDRLPHQVMAEAQGRSCLDEQPASYDQVHDVEQGGSRSAEHLRQVGHGDRAAQRGRDLQHSRRLGSEVGHPADDRSHDAPDGRHRSGTHAVHERQRADCLDQHERIASRPGGQVDQITIRFRASRSR